jgi:hypothetical protein
MKKENIQDILQSAADKIKNSYGGKCFAIVIESFRDFDDEYALSVHLMSPKLKNYTYRIFEFKCKNEINPFPIAGILFAYHPKNNQYVTYSDYESLQTGVDIFVNHPLTKAIIEHIISMSEIAQNDEISEINVRLSQSNKTEQIKIERPSKQINLKKIIVTSHFNSENNEWLNVVLNTQLKISCSGMLGGGTFSNIFSLISFVSAYHNKPLFDLNIDFPSRVDMIQFDNKLVDQLEYNVELISSIPSVELSIVFEKYQFAE